MPFEEEVQRRRTFAIISHPDAGKTTITEKILYLGGVIREAGEVHGKAGTKKATSDWMTLEQQRGVSITSSVMQFDFKGLRVNLLDTPGHKDFSEDTYRTLIAADSKRGDAIDAAKGVETQDAQALRGLPPQKNSDLHVCQQDGPRGQGAARAHRRRRNHSRHQVLSGDLADRHRRPLQGSLPSFT